MMRIQFVKIADIGVVDKFLKIVVALFILINRQAELIHIFFQGFFNQFGTRQQIVFFVVFVFPVPLAVLELFVLNPLKLFFLQKPMHLEQPFQFL